MATLFYLTGSFKLKVQDVWVKSLRFIGRGFSIDKYYELKEYKRLGVSSLTLSFELKFPQIRDISRVEIPGLPHGVTASNFGKAEANAAPDDIAAGIVNMILQTIGSAANLVAFSTSVRDFVLIGNLPLLPQSRPLFDRIEALYDIRMHIPEYPEYRTAIGAALSYTSRP